MKSRCAFQELPRVVIRLFEMMMAVGLATRIGRLRPLGSNFFPWSRLALVIRALGSVEFLCQGFRWAEDRVHWVEWVRGQCVAKTGPIAGERLLRGLRPSGCGA